MTKALLSRFDRHRTVWTVSACCRIVEFIFVSYSQGIIRRKSASDGRQTRKCFAEKFGVVLHFRQRIKNIREKHHCQTFLFFTSCAGDISRRPVVFAASFVMKREQLKKESDLEYAIQNWVESYILTRRATVV